MNSHMATIITVIIDIACICWAYRMGRRTGIDIGERREGMWWLKLIASTRRFRVELPTGTAEVTIVHAEEMDKKEGGDNV